jgi:hypothetical protein
MLHEGDGQSNSKKFWKVHGQGQRQERTLKGITRKYII